MPETEPIVVLEKHVQRLLEAVKRLREDNAQLHERVRQFRHQLTKNKTEESRWTQDRSRVESKVRKLIADLDTLSQSHAQD